MLLTDTEPAAPTAEIERLDPLPPPNEALMTPMLFTAPMFITVWTELTDEEPAAFRPLMLVTLAWAMAPTA